MGYPKIGYPYLMTDVRRGLRALTRAGVCTGAVTLGTVASAFVGCKTAHPLGPVLALYAKDGASLHTDYERNGGRTLTNDAVSDCLLGHRIGLERSHAMVDKAGQHCRVSFKEPINHKRIVASWSFLKGSSRNRTGEIA